MRPYTKSAVALVALAAGLTLWVATPGQDEKEGDARPAAVGVPAGAAVGRAEVRGLKVDFYDLRQFEGPATGSIGDAKKLIAEKEPALSYTLNADSIDVPPRGAPFPHCGKITLGEFLLGKEELASRKRAAEAGKADPLPQRFDEEVGQPSMFVFTGFVEVEEAGTRTLTARVDDAVEVAIGGTVVHVQPSEGTALPPEGRKNVSTVTVTEPGIYPVRVLFYNNAGNLGLRLLSDLGQPEKAPRGRWAPLVFLQSLRPDGAAEPWVPPRFTERQRDREQMTRVIRSYGLTDRAVLKAMAAVPRNEFVPRRLSSSAHADRPLPIGYGQTISQPYIVAEMTRQLELKPRSRVLEIGTGSGYQAAVLTEFTPHVCSIEIIKALADAAAKRLKGLGYDVVKVRHGDGYYGWPEEAPFDAIIVTAAAGQIPPPLLEQLSPGGRMVIPVGSPFATQSLMLVTKGEDGAVHSRSLMGVRFVPLTREER